MLSKIIFKMPAQLKYQAKNASHYLTHNNLHVVMKGLSKM